MERLKQLRGLIIAFVSGMSLSQLSIGIKICIAVPLLLLWFMNYDEKKFDKRKRVSYD
ncbi:hypothetical protein [Enterococcus wangshanyuanii]|uniref:Uncharacterized protein n=1 Tax=Enterococcus wangshanyuanii TaxID=2005703 RepID=A0ABQ1NH83_9ENTE|nr:hypothetical protein [Enterococcus wangshanyuanii]GGC74549.1 hypothetical protein GCM10011573_00050 [Enterococcus wangshanyuanii]